MKKRFLITALILCFAFIFASAAFAQKTYMIDKADVLSNEQESELNTKLESLSKKHKMDFVCLTVDIISGSLMTYADDYYDQNGYADDGMLILVETSTGERYISLTGDAIDIFQEELDCFTYASEREFDSEKYYEAFLACADTCDELIAQEKQRSLILNIIISVVIALIAAFIVTSSMKSALKSVKFSGHAANYVKQGSLNVTGANDFFLYHIINRRAKVNNNAGSGSRHVSSSGRTHGGGSF